MQSASKLSTAVSAGVIILLTPFLTAGAANCKLDVSLTETARRLLAPMPEKNLPGYLQQLSRLSQCQLRERDFPMARLVPAFAQGQTTLLIGMLQTSERDKLGRFYPLMNLQTYWISRQAPPPDTLAALQKHDYRLGVVRGAVFPPSLMQAFATLRNSQQLDEVSNEETALRMVQAGRNTAFIAVDTTYYSLRKQQQLRGLSGWPLQDIPLLKIGIYLNPDKLSKAQLARIDDAINTLSRRKHVQQLLYARLGYQANKAW